MESLEYQLNKCLSGRGQAVASILGMNTDANVVASLNPGLSTRNLDSGIVHSTPARGATHGEVWETRSGVSRGMYGSGPVHVGHATPPSSPIRAGSESGINIPNTPASSGHMRASSPSMGSGYPRPGTPVPRGSGTHSASAPIATEMPEPTMSQTQLQKSGMAAFGWVMLVLILLGGAGALAYVMLFNKKPATTVPGNADGSDATGSGSGSTTDEMLAPDEHEKKEPGKKSRKDKGDKGDKGEKLDKTGSAEKAVTEPTKGSASDPDKGSASEKTTNKTVKKTGKQVAVAEDKASPKEISDQAKKAESSGDWDAARLAYERLEKTKGYAYPGFAIYKQAQMAFQANDTTDALNLAQRASNLPGNQKLMANELYADALFKQGDFKHAKDFYLMLRKKVDDKKKAQLAKKIGACNTKLKLPERDGLTN
jgi:hypothetical protein